MRKKAQLEMIEMLMVLIVIVIMISFGILFYYGFFISSIRKGGEVMANQEASVLLATIAFMPEFQCSVRTTDVSCIDTLKLYSFKRILREKKYQKHYVSLFKWKQIQFERIYPIPKSKEECKTTHYQALDYPENCAIWTVYNNSKLKYDSKVRISTPVSLYYPTTGEYAVGKLIIEAYR